MKSLRGTGRQRRSDTHSAPRCRVGLSAARLDGAPLAALGRVIGRHGVGLPRG